MPNLNLLTVMGKSPKDAVCRRSGCAGIRTNDQFILKAFRAESKKSLSDFEKKVEQDFWKKKLSNFPPPKLCRLCCGSAALSPSTSASASVSDTESAAAAAAAVSSDGTETSSSFSFFVLISKLLTFSATKERKN